MSLILMVWLESVKNVKISHYTVVLFNFSSENFIGWNAWMFSPENPTVYYWGWNIETAHSYNKKIAWNN